MTDLAADQTLKFDTELTLSAASFTGTPQLIGTLRHNPVIMLFKNQSTVPVFISDENGSTVGTTMISGEHFVLDCRGNHGGAANMGFGKGTSFYLTGTGGTGGFKISILYAK